MVSEIIDFEEERARHGQVFGRDDVLARLRALLYEELGRGWVLLRGGPGVGKSAIVHVLLDMLPEEMAYHFIRRGNKGLDRPAVVVQNLCARIERIFPERVNLDLPIEARLGDLLQRVSRNHLVSRDGRPERRLILVIDGLDEADCDASGRYTLPDYLPGVPPRGVVILCVSRPMHPHLGWLHERRARLVDLDDRNWQDTNDAAIRAFWQHHAPRFSPPLAETFVEEAVRRAGGNWLHALLLLHWIEDQPTARRVASSIPNDLPGFLGQIWAAIHELEGTRRDLVLRGLGLACAAREALPDSLFGELLGSSTSTGEAFLRATRPFLREEQAQWLGGRLAYQLYHECLRELIAERLGDRRICEHHAYLVEKLAAWPPDEWDPLGPAYAVRHAVTHRLEAGQLDAAYRLCVDVSYLEAKCIERGVDELERDFEAVIQSHGADVALDLRAILAAVRADADRLREHPGSLPALLYNRLRCAGWSPTRIEQVLHVDEDLPRLRLLHGVRLRPTRLRMLIGHDNSIVACAAAPDGRMLVSASTDGSLRLWDLRTGDCVAKLKGHDDELTGCVVTPDGRYAISTSGDATAKVWDLAARQCIDTFRNDGRSATACAVRPDGRRLVIGSDNGTLAIWDLAARQRVATLRGHDGYVTACLWTPSGHIVSASRDQSVRIWDPDTGTCLHKLVHTEVPPVGRGNEEQGWINAIVLLPDGKHILAAAGDGSLRRWDLASGRCAQPFGAGQGRVDACALLHDGRYVLCGTEDGSLVIWDVARQKRVLRFSAHEGAVSSMAVTANGQRILSAGSDRSIRLWDLGGPESLASPDSHDASVNACALTPDGRIAVSASEDRTLKIWDVETGVCLNTFTGHSEPVTSCAISAEGGRVLSGARDGSVLSWDLRADRAEARADRSNFVLVGGCAVLPDGRTITASRAPEGVLLLRGPNDLTRAVELAVHGGAVEGLALTPNGMAMAIAGDGSAYILDVATGQSVSLLPAPTARPLCGALTPDLRRAVLARQDGTLELIDLRSRHVVATLPGHARRILGCAVSADGKRVYTASEDGTLRVFSLETRKCIATLHGTSGFRCVAEAHGRICAGDDEGNLWMIIDETGAEVPPPRGVLSLPPEARLRDALARLYDSDGKAAVLLRDIQMDVTQIVQGGSLRENWDAICAEAKKQKRLEALRLRALNDYPADEELQELLGCFPDSRGSRQGRG